MGLTICINRNNYADNTQISNRNRLLSTSHYPQLKIKKEYERIRKQLDEKMGIGKRKNRLPC